MPTVCRGVGQAPRGTIAGREKIQSNVLNADGNRENNGGTTVKCACTLRNNGTSREGSGYGDGYDVSLQTESGSPKVKQGPALT